MGANKVYCGRSANGEFNEDRGLENIKSVALF